jgi:hypothetical protein
MQAPFARAVLSTIAITAAHTPKTQAGNTATPVRLRPVTVELLDEQTEALAAHLDGAIRRGQDIDLPSEGSTMLRYQIRSILVDVLIADGAKDGDGTSCSHW